MNRRVLLALAVLAAGGTGAEAGDPEPATGSADWPFEGGAALLRAAAEAKARGARLLIGFSGCPT